MSAMVTRREPVKPISASTRTKRRGHMPPPAAVHVSPDPNGNRAERREAKRLGITQVISNEEPDHG